MKPSPPKPYGPFGFIERMLAQLHRDESGATLTEFVIMLPIFVMIFHGVMVLGQFTRKGSEAPIRAYKGTFDKALDFQKSSFAVDEHMQSSAGGGAAAAQLAPGDSDTAAPIHNRSGAVKGAAIATEGAAYAGLTAGGHMGESYARTETIGLAMDLRGCEGMTEPASNDCVPLNGGGTDDRLQHSMGGLTGGSDFTAALLDDAIKFNSPSGAAPFEMLNEALDILGSRPAIAAGIRYGTVAHRAGESYTFAGQTKDISAHFSTLIPPSTQGEIGGMAQGPRMDALRATAVVRMTMESSQHGHYSELLGIDNNQPLDSASYSVPDYP